MNVAHDSLIERHPVASFFVLTFGISWAGAFAIVAPKLFRGQPIPKLDGILMFPAMLLGPSVAGILLTRVLHGKSAVRDLFRRIVRFRISPFWYLALLIPPAAILLVLSLLTRFASSIFAHGSFLFGVTFAVAAAIFEEIGWMGYAFPKMRRASNALGPAIVLGLLWSCWHIPVINYLGTAVPHGKYWLPYFLAFSAVMTAMRVLICWLYANTESVALTQLLHMSSTGSLVALSPPGVSAAQEVQWYFAYAGLLWVAVLTVAIRFGKRLGESTFQPASMRGA